MIVDTSAMMAILKREPEAAVFSEALARAGRVAMAAPTLVELGMVAESRAGEAIRARIERLLLSTKVEIMPFTAAHAAAALKGWRRFGKGRHAAGLNLGDCFAYALAIERNEPLLFKGADFALTDVKRAL